MNIIQLSFIQREGPWRQADWLSVVTSYKKVRLAPNLILPAVLF